MEKRYYTILAWVLVLALLSATVLAGDFKRYDGGMIVTPFPVGVFVEVSDLDMPGVLVTACNLRTEYCEETTTNKDGYAQFELGNFMVPSVGQASWLPGWLPGDTITVKACNNADKCLQSFALNAVGVAKEPPAILHYYLTTDLEKVVVIEKKVPSEKKEGQVVIKDSDVGIDLFDNDTEVKDVENGLAWYWWMSGFIALCAFFYSGMRLRGSKMWETFLKNHKMGKYARR